MIRMSPSFASLSRLAVRTGALVLAASVACAVLPGCASPGAGASAGVVRSGDSISFPVEGMACPNCAHEVEHALAKVPGVKSAKVDFKASRATVTLNSEHAATLDQLQKAVAAWHDEHFTQEEDPNCLDPAKRAELMKKDSAAKE